MLRYLYLYWFTAVIISIVYLSLFQATNRIALDEEIVRRVSEKLQVERKRISGQHDSKINKLYECLPMYPFHEHLSY